MQQRSKFQIRSDAAKQRWVRDSRKESFWRKHVDAWKASGESKRGYCIKRNLSESSFNAWHRELGIRDREKVASANAEALLSSSIDQSKNLFVPLRLISEESKADAKQESSVEQPEAKPVIEVLVPGGAVIRVDESCSPDFVATLFATLKGRDSSC